jgi:type 1 glutamine amidotransferase
MGEKTGAYEATVTSDPAIFTAEKLKPFDAVVLACVYLEGKLFKVPRDLTEKDKPIYEARQKALLDFVESGKGLVGIHNATCTALGWPEFHKMIGGTHHGHAWHAHQSVPLKLDDPKHPLNAAFGGEGFAVNDDIYVFTTPYSRESLHVLLSVDVPKAPPSFTADRADGDYPVSWVKAHGKGRVFYTALGDNPATFQHPKFLRHLLDGIQFALGDLKADTAPGKPLPVNPEFVLMKGWTPLFDGKDLEAWKLDDKQKTSWRVEDGILRYDGKSPTLWTKEAFGNFQLRVDWRLPRVGDSGVFLRTGRQLNIWTWSMGSGEMWEYRTAAKTDEERKMYTPTLNADKGVGEWNTFHVTLVGDRVTVLLNDREVISKAHMKGIPAKGPIGLQQHGDSLEFKSIYIKKVEPSDK